MSENLFPSRSEIFQTEGLVTRMSRLAQGARLNYFGIGIRREITEDEPFEIFGHMPPYILGVITGKVNSHIQKGGDVVVMDFPQSGKDIIRTQIFNAERYIRHVGPPDPLGLNIKEKRIGNFSIKMVTPNKDKKVRGALSLEVKDKYGTETVFTSTWNNPEKQTRRFAIMTHERGKWDVILDFRLEEDMRVPAWKVNTQVYSR